MRLAFSVVLCASCATAAPAEKPITIAPPAPVAESKADFTELKKELERSKVSGFALLDRKAMLSPTKAVAALESSGSGFAYVAVAEDLGSAIRIRTGIEKAGLGELDESYDIEAFVPRAALVPVLARAIVKDMQDGTGFVLLEGLELALEDRVKPRDPMVARLPVELGANDVALGFEMPEKAADLAKADGAELGCASAEKRTRVAEREVLRKARIDAWRASHPHDDPFMAPYGFDRRPDHNEDPCHLVSTGDLETNTDRVDAELKVGGATLGKASSISDSFLVVRRAKGADVFVTFEASRARIRALTVETALASDGGTVSGGALMLNGLHKKIPAVSGAATAYFPDGSRAGAHEGEPTKLRGSHEVGGRICFPRPYFSVDLCHDKADLKEVDDTPY